jgi:hypothetical protein
MANAIEPPFGWSDASISKGVDAHSMTSGPPCLVRDATAAHAYSSESKLDDAPARSLSVSSQ